MNSFIHSLNQYFSSIYSVPGMVLGTGNAGMNQTDKNPCPHRTYILVGDGKQETKSISKIDRIMASDKSSGEKLAGRRDREHVCMGVGKEIVELQF